MVSKESLYGAFVDYFGDLGLTRIKESDGWSVYSARVYSGLNQQRYIFVIVPTQASKGDTTSLNQLDWVSFQTRQSDDQHKVPIHNVYLTDERKKLLPDKITIVNRTKDETIYVTDSLPITVRLLHDQKKNNYLQYPDQATLYQALNTFRCVVDLL